MGLPLRFRMVADGARSARIRVNQMPVRHRRQAPPAPPPIRCRVAPTAALVLGVAVLAALAPGCGGGRVVDGTYANPDTGFRIPAPPAPWVPAALPDVDVAFRHPGAGTIAVFSECGGSERGPLRSLARHLFFGLKGQRIVEQAPVSLNGAEALRTVVRGTLEGRPVVVDSVVVRRGMCVVDLVLAAPPDAYAVLRPALERMVAGWAPLP